MQSRAKPTEPRRDIVGVHALLKALGLRTYSGDQARAVFKSEAVKRLYKLGISALFGILCRDEGIVLDRDDPSLFEEELDKLLLEFGPQIWPQPGEGNRTHLHEARAGTAYNTDLWYPRDATILKQHLRSLILAKRTTPTTDIQALIEKRHKDANTSPAKRGRRSVKSTPAQQTSSRATPLSQDPQATPHTFKTNTDYESDSEDSVVGIITRRRAFETASSTIDFSSIELRLYRKIRSSRPSEFGPVVSYGPMFLTSDCTTAHDCFNRVCEEISTDCSFMIFHLPEDMSLKGSTRLDRGSGDAETVFQILLNTFRKAKKFPGGPHYRSVEVEVGLDMS